MDNEEHKRKALEPIVNYIESVMASYSKEELEDRIKKALPEKESEDERIRKEILEYFNQFCDRDLRGVDISDWIAWLEKQKEQKPAEWSEEDRKMLDAIIKRYSFPIETDFSVFVGEDNLKDMREELGWLKSLRPRPKQEWADGDEEKLEIGIQNWLHENDCRGWDKYGNIYVSMSKLVKLVMHFVAPHWIPSVEQMIELMRAISGCSFETPVLESLYEQLKSL